MSIRSPENQKWWKLSLKLITFLSGFFEEEFTISNLRLFSFKFILISVNLK